MLQDMIKSGAATVLGDLDIDVKELASMDPEEAADQILDKFDRNGDDGLQKVEMHKLVNHVRV